MLLTPILTCLVLVWVLIEDMRRYVIRNVSVLVLTACFVLDCVLRRQGSLLLPHAIFAAAGFALLLGGFALRAVGGGDTKLLSAALLWVGPEGCFVFAVCLLLFTVLYVAGAWLGWLQARRVGTRMAIPFGPSIALAWMAYIGLAAWL